ncbi:helix-turn-helix domain-containing protein [Lentilactobacillus sp. Marseille-Q4993]|uniref:helix-turn-helix domain-containing protein n=1 Tax=Lentilactobacillus sp. Marseille-Q4993 TaxID=3039492 RepID=UPI0024BCC88A|nr:helix-turn-helix domain-containing protein [Lentilactobacillus sp. Marseille-Q4993]
MNIELFVQTRKRLGYSQEELCEGICTQATLSKFEKSGKAPAIRILTKLCSRLGLTLDDIFPIVPPAQSEAIRVLDKAEFKLITSEFATAEEELKTIELSDLPTDGKMQYHFIQGFLAALQDKPLSDSLFSFDQILNDLDDAHKTIYSQLAFTGIGTAYFRNGDLDKSEFYFQKVFDELHSLPLNGEKAVWRAMAMIFYTADYFAHAGDFETSDSLLVYGYEVCANNHVTYYLARSLFRQAQNAREEKKPATEITDYLNDAKAFAKLNKNQKLLKRIAEFKI